MLKQHDAGSFLVTVQLLALLRLPPARAVPYCVGVWGETLPSSLSWGDAVLLQFVAIVAAKVLDCDRSEDSGRVIYRGRVCAAAAFAGIMVLGLDHRWFEMRADLVATVLETIQHLIQEFCRVEQRFYRERG
jgi:hypothetical protein